MGFGSGVIVFVFNYLGWTGYVWIGNLYIRNASEIFPPEAGYSSEVTGRQFQDLP